MHETTITLKLEGVWELLTPEWRNVFAANLGLNGYFSRNDIDYILTLSEMDCSKSGILDLNPLYLVPDIELLDISSTQIADFSALSTLTQLRSLSAVFCNIENTNIFSSLSCLEVLDLSYSYADSLDLCGIKQLASLKELYLNGCGIQGLSEVIDLSQLEVLSLYFTKIPKKEIEAFRKKNPNCRVLA